MIRSNEPLLRVSDLTMMYGDRVGCRNVSFELRPGEVLGIVGESGSGKSTLLRSISAQQEPTKGMVEYHTRIDGIRDVYQMSEAQRRFLMRTRLGVCPPECPRWIAHECQCRGQYRRTPDGGR